MYRRAIAALGVLGLCLVPLLAQQPDAKDKDADKDKDKDKDKKWDISQSLGPERKIDFTTSEGTWINLDVSPDGERIVFDLLGDLYTMPIAGGPATRLTSGTPFDMQPRFSPDGRWIAFSSDRDGLWNIWVMKPDGSGARQVSKETSWYVNSPAWSPDNQYVYARRHFVKERSGGAGEVWMYHAAGTGGLQVTEKNGWQKDAGEPAPTPDGRHLFYSKDVTPGQTFEYNKDPYGVIYAIVRRDLANGKERTAVSRAGGSITPRVSADGKSLAFIRRVRLKSVLYVRDLGTGVERPLFDGLDRDMQEAWAIHGVYTQYSWTPDSRSIVVWGGGRIWRVDVASGAATEIPFTAKVEQTAYERIVVPQDVHPKTFKVRMLRDVATAPDGRSVVFSALGHLYTRSLPTGEPRRLTGSDGFEFNPAFSADGRSIVFTIWSDATAGRVRLIPANGGPARDVVSKPGHYVDPSFSPDGSLIVYRAVAGDNIRGFTNAEETGLWIANADGSGQPRLVREGGTDPQFDHTGKRIYFRERRSEKFILASVDLDGGDEVVHFQSENATQIVPSPDGKWVAFAERYRAYVSAFPRSGRTIDLGPRVTAFPSARISQNAGLYLHWSGDSTRVFWALGPELFSRDLSRTFAFLSASDEKPAEPESAGLDISFSAPSDLPTGSVALVGARIITMADGSAAKAGAGRPARDGVIENGTIVVEGNRIVAVGPAGAVRVPTGATRIDVRGKTIIPGLIDAHAHVQGESQGLLAQTSWPLAANLAYGVTTAHDPSNDTETVFQNIELIRAGQKLGPRLFSTGTILYGAETPFKAVVDNYDDALAHIRRMKAVGAFSVKSYNQQRRDVRQMILKAARAEGLMVVPEGGSLVYYNETMVHDGHTGVEHSLPVPRVYNDIAQLFGQARSAYTPTLIVGYGGLFGENYWYQHANVWENQRLLTFTPREIVDARSRRRPMAADDDFSHIDISTGAKRILDAGGLVQLGAHGQLQGLGAHWELWMLQQGGMTPLEALRCGTLNGARYLGLDRDLGSLETGKLADLIVLDRNPLENIRNSDSVRYVMMNGRVYEAATLAEVGNRPRPRPSFWWEEPS
jgi:imidazolonepropionase-like amidohydrolase/Tol biopolymer transport system component